MIRQERKPKIIVTGANGFLGRVLCQSLQRAFSIVCVDLAGNDAFDLDLIKKIAWDELQRYLDSPRVFLIHLAFPFSSKAKMEDDNSRMLENLCGFMDKNIGLILLYPSTALVYGFHCQEGVKEEDAPRPESLYASIKLKAEDRLLRSFPSRCLVLRMTNIYGEELRKKTVIGTLLAQLEKEQMIALKDYNSTRDFIYRGDVVDVFLKMMVYLSRNDDLDDRERKGLQSPYSVFNVCTGKGTLIYDLAFELAAIRHKLHLLPEKDRVMSIGEREYLVPSPGKLKAFFAEAKSRNLVDDPWEPMMIQDGLKKVVEH